MTLDKSKWSLIRKRMIKYLFLGSSSFKMIPTFSLNQRESEKSKGPQPLDPYYKKFKAVQRLKAILTGRLLPLSEDVSSKYSKSTVAVNSTFVSVPGISSKVIQSSCCACKV